MNKLLEPIWEGREIHNESLLPLAGRDGNALPLNFLYRADEIKDVRSATLETVYERGRDYVPGDGCLLIPKGSKIPLMAWDDYYPQQNDGACFEHSEGGFIRFGEGAYFHKRQIAVSYTHSDPWRFAVPADKSELLPRSMRLLSAKEPIRILIFGDSISTGVNASGTVDAPPYQKPWFELMADGLRERFHNDRIALINTSVGGKTSVWGRETAKENAAEQRPDLCVIAFGMNDGSGRKPPEVFTDNLRAIMDMVANENPACEFVLIATTLANGEVKGFYGLQEAYLAPMLAMERKGVCVADMTTLHKALLSRKAFRDMTGNNVNHPNDFLSRVYAQLMLRTLGAL